MKIDTDTNGIEEGPDIRDGQLFFSAKYLRQFNVERIILTKSAGTIGVSYEDKHKVLEKSSYKWGENICKNLSDKRVISRLYKELL